MPIVMKPLHPFSISSSLNSRFPFEAFGGPICSSLYKFQLCKSPNRVLFRKLLSTRNLVLSGTHSIRRATQVVFCYGQEISETLTNIKVLDNSQNVFSADSEELELRDKPSPILINVESDTKAEIEPQKADKDEALEPFLKFFRSKDSEEELTVIEENEVELEKESEKVVVEYYEPKPGDFVVGVIVSGNENRLDVNVGADLLGTMLTKEILPLYSNEMDSLLCDFDNNAEEFMANGKMGIVRYEDAVSGKPTASSPVVDVLTVIFAEVLGRTLSGRPLLSCRHYFRRIAWHRVRQLKQLGEPIQVRITEWNTGGLLTRIEGLRAFLPKAELVERVHSFTDLKAKVGRQIYVQINRINEENNDLILSEREAWEKLFLREGTLLEGTITKIFPYGAQVKIGQTNRSGLLHLSNISRGKVDSVSDVLAVGEKVKVLVVRSLFPDKISLSIADLESEPGLFISNKQRVFGQAEGMARNYRRKLPKISTTQLSEHPTSSLFLEAEENLYANWKWFVFQNENETDLQ